MVYIWHTLRVTQLKISVFVIAHSFLIFSCEEVKDCTPQTTDFIKVAFRDTISNSLVPVVFDSIYELNSGTLLFDFDDTLSIFEIPLNPELSNSSYLFSEQGIVNTLDVSYRNLASIISVECGVELIFAELSLDQTTFDSIRIIETEFFSELTENNVEIYR